MKFWTVTIGTEVVKSTFSQYEANQFAYFCNQFTVKAVTVAQIAL